MRFPIAKCDFPTKFVVVQTQYPKNDFVLPSWLVKQPCPFFSSNKLQLRPSSVFCWCVQKLKPGVGGVEVQWVHCSTEGARMCYASVWIHSSILIQRICKKEHGEARRQEQLQQNEKGQAGEKSHFLQTRQYMHIMYGPKARIKSHNSGQNQSKKASDYFTALWVSRTLFPQFLIVSTRKTYRFHWKLSQCLVRANQIHLVSFASAGKSLGAVSVLFLAFTLMVFHVWVQDSDFRFPWFSVGLSRLLHQWATLVHCRHPKMLQPEFLPSWGYRFSKNVRHVFGLAWVPRHLPLQDGADVDLVAGFTTWRIRWK